MVPKVKHGGYGDGIGFAAARPKDPQPESEAFGLPALTTSTPNVARKTMIVKIKLLGLKLLQAENETLRRKVTQQEQQLNLFLSLVIRIREEGLLAMEAGFASVIGLGVLAEKVGELDVAVGAQNWSDIVTHVATLHHHVTIIDRSLLHDY